MGAFESFLKRVMMSIGGGGGEEPKKNVYTSRMQIDKDNAFVKDFLMRHGAPQANMAVVARDIGDPIPQFVTPEGRPYVVDKPALQTTLPTGVSVDDVFRTNEGIYGFMHPQNGNFVQVDPNYIYSKYKKESPKK